MLKLRFLAISCFSFLFFHVTHNVNIATARPAIPTAVPTISGIPKSFLSEPLLLVGVVVASFLFCVTMSGEEVLSVGSGVVSGEKVAVGSLLLLTFGVLSGITVEVGFGEDER